MEDRPRPAGLAARAHVGIDQALLSIFRRSSVSPDDASMHYQGQLVAHALTVHERHGWTGNPGAYLQAPPPFGEPTRTPGRRRGVDFAELSWPSEHRPHPEEVGAAAWMARKANRTAHAWVVETDPEAPWLVCVHGHSAGVPWMDVTGFHVAHLAKTHGVNLAFPVLPRHGRRRENPVDSGGFLTGDVLEATIGTSQGVWDVRRLIGWLRESRGATRVGLYGVSLGSWISAIVAGVEDDLDLVMAGIPLMDVIDLFRRHAPADQRDRAIELGAIGARAQALLTAVSPMFSTPKVPVSRRRIYAGALDQLTSARQAEQLLDHWGQPEHLWFGGGHVGFVFDRSVRAFVDDAVRDLLTNHPAEVEPV